MKTETDIRVRPVPAKDCWQLLEARREVRKQSFPGAWLQSFPSEGAWLN